MMGTARCGFRIRTAADPFQGSSQGSSGGGGPRRRDVQPRGSLAALRVDDMRSPLSSAAAAREHYFSAAAGDADAGGASSVSSTNSGGLSVMRSSGIGGIGAFRWPSVSIPTLSRAGSYNLAASEPALEPTVRQVTHHAASGQQDLFQMDLGGVGFPFDDGDPDDSDAAEPQPRSEAESDSEKSAVAEQVRALERCFVQPTAGGLRWPSSSPSIPRDGSTASASDEDRQQQQQSSSTSEWSTTSFGRLVRNLSGHSSLPAQQRLGGGVQAFGQLMRSLSGHRPKSARDKENDIIPSNQGGVPSRAALFFSSEQISKRVETPATAQRSRPITTPNPPAPGSLGLRRVAKKSAPMAVPQRQAKAPQINDEEDGGFVPPHEFLIQRECEKDPFKLANPSTGRLKGLPSLRFRNKVLTTTGFYDGYTEMWQRSSNPMSENMDWPY